MPMSTFSSDAGKRRARVLIVDDALNQLDL
jgi:hypothetical protein